MENKKIILSFEGPDNVGKGTQVKKVVEHFKTINFVCLYDSLKAGESDEEKVDYGKKREEVYFNVRNYLWEQNLPQINDRSHYSEYAYRMFRNSDKIDDLLELEKKYINLSDDYLTLIFVDNPENISKRDDGESAYKAEDLKSISELIDRFRFISEKSIFENYIIDINGKDEDEVFEMVLKKIKNKFYL